MGQPVNNLLKNHESEQLCRVGQPNSRSDASASLHAPSLLNTAIAPLADQWGRLIVVVDAPAGDITSGRPVRFLTSGTELVYIVATPVQAYGMQLVTGYNAGPSAAFVQIWENKVGNTPGGGSSLKAVIPVEGNRTTFSYGVKLTHGFPSNASTYSILLSTTEFDVTDPPAPYLYINANYIAGF